MGRLNDVQNKASKRSNLCCVGRSIQRSARSALVRRLRLARGSDCSRVPSREDGPVARAKMPDRVATDCKCYESCLSVAVGGPRGRRPKAFDRAQVTGEEDVLYGRGIASRCDPIYEERGRSLLSVRSKTEGFGNTA